MENEETKQTMGNKIFYVVLALLLIGSVGFTFWRIVVQKDYQIIAEVSCNPVFESCFYYEAEEPDESYNYKLISKKARTIYLCEQTEEKLGCDEELSCLEGEEACDYTMCDPENLGEEEVCSEPVEEEINQADESIDEEITEEVADELSEFEEKPE